MGYSKQDGSRLISPHSEEREYSFQNGRKPAGGNDFLIIARMARAPDMLTRRIVSKDRVFVGGTEPEQNEQNH